MFELSSWLERNRDHSFQTLSLYTFPILDSFTDYSIKQACSKDMQCHIDWYLLRLSVCLIKLCWTFYRYYFFSKRVRYWVLVRTLPALTAMIPLSMFAFNNLPCLLILPLIFLWVPNPSWNLSNRWIRHCFERFHGLLFYWL